MNRESSLIELQPEGTFSIAGQNDAEEANRLRLLLGFYDTLLDRFMPPMILIDSRSRVVDTFAGADRFLRIAARRPSHDLMELLLEPFRPAVGEALARCSSTGQSVLTPPIAIEDFEDLAAGERTSEGERPASSAGVEPFWFRARVSPVPHRNREQIFFSIEIEEADRRGGADGVAGYEASPAKPMRRASTAGFRGYINLPASGPNVVRENATDLATELPFSEPIEDLCEANRLALIVLDSELRIRRFSRPAATLFGLLPQDIGRGFRTFAGGIDSGDLVDRLVQALRTGDPDEFEIHQERQGTYHLARVKPLGDPAGSAGLMLTLIDLSSLEAKRRECERLSNIVHSSADAIISRDVDNRIVTWNAAAEDLYGYSAAEAIGATADLIVPETEVEERRNFQLVLRRDQHANHFDASRVTKGGDLVRVSVRLSPIYDAEHRVVGISTIERDVSDRAEWVRRLSQSEKMLQAFYDQSPEMYFSIDALNGVITDCNESMGHQLGLSRAQIIGRSILDFPSECSRPKAKRCLEQLREHGMLHGEELELRRNDGGTMPVSLCAMAIYDNEAQLIGARGLCRDLTALREKDQLIQQSETRYREAFENCAIGMAHCGLDGRITMANKRLCEIVGYSSQELACRTFAELTHPEDLPRDRPYREALLSGEKDAYQLEKRYQHRDGRTVWVSVNVSIKRDAAGKPVAFHKFIEDISVRKEFENGLQSAIRQRDQFLAMLSHELRNPLGAILNTCAVLGKRRTLSKLYQNGVSIVSRQARQMAELLDDLLDVSRITTGKIKLEKSNVDLASIADEAIESQKALADSRGQRITVTYCDDSLQVFGDRSRLVQIVVNLLNNAIKYTGDGGRITVVLERKDQVGVIRVRDTGVGLETEQIESLFEMFAQQDSTLDRSGGGMGLGLHLVRKLVDFHSGTVTGRSDGLGKGSEFIVELPLSSRRPKEQRGGNKISPKGGRRVKRIVVVEDIEDARKMLVALLEADGYEVTSAADGEAGLQLIVGQRPDLAIVDIGLPKLDGYEVARRVRQEIPAGEIRLVALTGYGQDSDHELVMRAGFDTHLVKPLNHTRLEKILAGF